MKKMKIAFSAVLIASAVTPVAYASEASVFPDVKHYAQDIQYLVSKRLMNGYEDGTFRPNVPITRLQAITVLLREARLVATTLDVAYIDVKKGDYGYEAVMQATALGMISGKQDGSFDKAGHLTRGQFAKILVEAYDIPLNEDNIVHFDDVQDSHWYAPYVQILASHGIVTGYEDNMFKAGNKVTRAHFAVQLSRFFKNKDVIFQVKDVAIEQSTKKPVEARPIEEKPVEQQPVEQNTQTPTETEERERDRDRDRDDNTGGTPVEPEPTEPKPTEPKPIEPKPIEPKPVISITPRPTPDALGVDTDGDGLSDHMEVALGTNPNNPDTDGDGLFDGFEYMSKIYSPTKADTDGNGIADGDEDPDRDGLSNVREVALGTNPFVADTDGDGLSDGEEVAKGTNPLLADTDGDGLLDSQEEQYGFDPTKADTDGNGIADGDEVILHATSAPAYLQAAAAYPEVKISSAAKEAATTEVLPIAPSHPVLNEAIPGMIGHAYSFNSDVNFDEAEMQFYYNPSTLDPGAQPAIYYYNEAAQKLEKLPNQTHDPLTNTVTATVNHFSSYVLVDTAKWEKIWEESVGIPVLDETGGVQLGREVVFSVDSSGSMASNDQNRIRITASKTFVSKLGEEDEAAVVQFSSSATLLSGMTSDKEALYAALERINASGGTNLSAGFTKALDQYTGEETNRIMIFLTDGDGTWNAELIDVAIEKNVKVFTIGLGSNVSADKLKDMANRTGGKYYAAQSAEDLTDILDETSEQSDLLTKDTDGDGIPDYYEINGLVTGTGEVIYTDSNNADTDGDGLLDGEEIEFVAGEGTNKGYIILRSHPLKKDSDNDGYLDGEETVENRLVYNVSDKVLATLADLSYADIGDYADNAAQKEDLAKLSPKAKPLAIVDTGLQTKSRLSNYSHLLKDWEVIGYEQAANNYYGVVFRHNSTFDVVLANRGRDVGGSLMEDLVTNVDLLVDGSTPQLDNARALTVKAITNNSFSKFYVTGHSLGGFTAQAVTFDLLNNHLTRGGTAQTERLNALIDQNYKRTATFNAVPLLKKDSLRKMGIGLAAYTNPAIPLSVISYSATTNDIADVVITPKNSGYASYITNYRISNDLLTNVGQFLGAGYLGQTRTINNDNKTMYDLGLDRIGPLISAYNAEYLQKIFEQEKARLLAQGDKFSDEELRALLVAEYFEQNGALKIDTREELIETYLPFGLQLLRTELGTYILSGDGLRAHGISTFNDFLEW